jgi:hypothetical protein
MSQRGIERAAASDGAYDVEIEFESWNELMPFEAIVALEAWLLERGRPSVAILFGGRLYALRPHFDGVEQGATSILARLWRRLHVARRASSTSATATPELGAAAEDEDRGPRTMVPSRA